MKYRFNQKQALEIIEKKRSLLGRGLSYVEKILLLHEAEPAIKKICTRGEDQIKLYPDRVAMQDATAQMAMLQFIQANRKKTQVPATIHCDHLLRASEGAATDLEKALETNREIYDFLASAAKKFGIGFWGPGSGIMHQVILENYALPGAMMIGTDSHTPNAGGLGMIAIGVGGADAAEVMAGLSWEMLHPYIVGVKLTGKLTGWTSAKDIVLEMLQRFTVKGGTGKIFEYFGEGSQLLSATQKSTITNMGAELGATTSVFVYDASMDAYLQNVGRQDDAAQARSFAEVFSQDEMCLHEPESVFDELVEIDLSTLEPSYAGPFTPDKITKARDFKERARAEKWPEKVSAVLLGSCTNSSYADLYAAAQVLEQASKHGCTAKVPFMLSPGSTQIYETIKRDGILDTLLEGGATVLSASCGPCIGQWERKDTKKGEPNCIFTAFNRNFRGRNDANPETRAFLTSPALLAALALSGIAGFNPETDTLTGSNGTPFKLVPPTAPPLPEKGLATVKGSFIPGSADGDSIEIKINPASKRLELLRPFEKWDGKDFIDLPVLIKTKGKTTTDHISPGGAWLQYRGHLTNISENMLEGASNAFTGEVGHATNVLTGEKNIRLPLLAKTYQREAGGFVIIGDENYGEGSSREHAAMSPRFLGARVVAARSFARIHESNLKKQGILPLTFVKPGDYDTVEEYDRLSFVKLSSLKPGRAVTCLVKKQEGTVHTVMLNHTLTEEQVLWFRQGSALNTMGEPSGNT